MNLDFRYNKINKYGDVSPLLSKIANKKKNHFTKIISNYSKSYNENLDWWFASPSSRNIISSRLFFNYCCLILVKDLISKGEKIDSIIVESKVHKKTILKLTEKYSPNIIINIKRSEDLRILVVLKNIYYIINKLYGFFICKIFIKNFNIGEAITIIDIFCFPGYITKDRYYTRFIDNLSNTKRKSIYFVPTIRNIYWNNWRKVYQELTKSTKNYLIKENFLHLSDYWFSIMHYKRFNMLPKNAFQVVGVDFSPFIKDEFKSMKGFQSSIEAFLNYCFFYRLNQSGIKINRVIDWWENQVIDKGWNYGKNKFYPKVDSIGNLGYIPRDLELQLFPTRIEKNNYLLPNKIGVIGIGLAKMLKIYNPDLEIIQIPAFRFVHLWSKKRKEKLNNGQIKIIVALSILNNESIEIINSVLSAQKYIDKNRYEFFIKFHPTNNREKIINNIKSELPNNFFISEDDVNTIFQKTDLLIGGTSSICLESMAMGLPVIVANYSQGIRYNPIPESISKKMWSIVNTDKELSQILKLFSKRLLNDSNYFYNEGIIIRKTFFNPIDRKYLTQFLTN
jgi:hypothetical protein